jgi:hypothetical protein
MDSIVEVDGGRVDQQAPRCLGICQDPYRANRVLSQPGGSEATIRVINEKATKHSHLSKMLSSKSSLVFAY